MEEVPKSVIRRIHRWLNTAGWMFAILIQLVILAMK